MKENIIVTLWDGCTGAFGPEELFHNMTAKEALITFLEQLKGNFNTWTYPEDLEGIYPSNCIKDRINYDLTEDIVVYAQRA